MFQSHAQQVRALPNKMFKMFEKIFWVANMVIMISHFRLWTGCSSQVSTTCPLTRRQGQPWLRRKSCWTSTESSVCLLRWAQTEITVVVAFLSCWVSLSWPSAPQHTQEKVHLLIQLAESMLAKGHAHRAELRRCVSAVDKRYREFTVRMGQYRHLLETELGGSSQVREPTQQTAWPKKSSFDFHASFTKLLCVALSG